jgi:membrane fusion protein (multidrug efflux system)
MAVQRKWIALTILIAFIVAGSVFGYLRWRHAQWHVETEDAYIQGRVYSVASRIPGTVLAVEVEENQRVEAGQTVATLDPKDYDAAVTRAQASLNEATAAVATNEAAIAQAKAQVEAAKSQLQLATTELDRASALYQRQSIPKQRYDQAVTAHDVAKAQLVAAQKAVSLAEAALEVSRKKVETAKASLDTAQLQRSYCAIVSPATGYVSKKSVEPGQVLAPGQPLFAVVPLAMSDIWVEANYKETQLANVRPGQTATIKADIDRSRTFSGTVESLSAGTGAAFSLLPPENATGNWVKVVQRLPVRIKFDPGTDPDHKLRVGLSVRVTIDTRSKSGQGR